VSETPNKLKSLGMIAAMLGGEKMLEGMSRIMDGQCPDCGEPNGEDDPHPAERCFQMEEQTNED
jgi:hypothetical protein